MIVHDSHCHFFSARFFEALGREKYGSEFDPSVHQVALQLGWEAPGDAQALANRWITELNRHRVSRAALIASIPGDEDSVATAVSAYPERFVGFFLVNPAAPDGVDRARRAYEELGLRCACLFPAMHRYRLDDERVIKLFEVASAARTVTWPGNSMPRKSSTPTGDVAGASVHDEKARTARPPLTW